MSPSRIAAITSGCLGLVGLQRAAGSPASTAGRAAPGSPGSSTISHRSLRSSSPSIAKTSSGSASSARSSCSRISRLMPGLDLDAHDLAEAAAAQLVLDRLQQVVGLVGDREVGVAGDAEDRVSTISMPGKSWSRCLAISSSSGTNVRPSASGTKRGSISVGTFTRAKICGAV